MTDSTVRPSVNRKKSSALPSVTFPGNPQATQAFGALSDMYSRRFGGSAPIVEKAMLWGDFYDIGAIALLNSNGQMVAKPGAAGAFAIPIRPGVSDGGLNPAVSGRIIVDDPGFVVWSSTPATPYPIMTTGDVPAQLVGSFMISLPYRDVAPITATVGYSYGARVAASSSAFVPTPADNTVLVRWFLCPQVVVLNSVLTDNSTATDDENSLVLIKIDAWIEVVDVALTSVKLLAVDWQLMRLA